MTSPFAGLSLTASVDTEESEAPELTVLSGQPDIAYCDLFQRPIATVCFPFIPRTTVVTSDAWLTMTQTRNEQEQAVVSRLFNTSGIFVLGDKFVPMHASHGSKHGLCGSAYRTNFHAVSATCNTATIKKFETELEALVRGTYKSAPKTPLELSSAPGVIVHATFTSFSPERVLPHLVGAADAQKVISKRKSNIMAGILWSMAESIPCEQVREVWVGELAQDGTRAWRAALKQTLNVMQIMDGAGTPEDPRYTISWDASSQGKVVAQWTNEFRAAVTGVPAIGFADNIGTVADNCMMFDCLSRDSQFSTSDAWRTMRSRCMLDGASNPVQVLSELASQRYPKLTTRTRSEGTVKATFELHAATKRLGGNAWTEAEALAYIRGKADGNAELIKRWVTKFLRPMFPTAGAGGGAVPMDIEERKEERKKEL